MPLVEGKGNRLWQPVYDTINLAAAAVAGSFFVVPVNGILVGAVVKTFAHSNLVQAGRLERDTTFYLNGISLFVRELAARATAADIRALNQGSFNLQFGGVSFFRCPIACIPNGGAELEYFSNIAPAATEYQLNKGVPAFGNRLLFDQPITILPQETIQADIADFAVVAAMQVTCVLWGTMDRPVR